MKEKQYTSTFTSILISNKIMGWKYGKSSIWTHILYARRYTPGNWKQFSRLMYNFDCCKYCSMQWKTQFKAIRTVVTFIHSFGTNSQSVFKYVNILLSILKCDQCVWLATRYQNGYIILNSCWICWEKIFDTNASAFEVHSNEKWQHNKHSLDNIACNSIHKHFKTETILIHSIVDMPIETTLTHLLNDSFAMLMPFVNHEGPTSPKKHTKIFSIVKYKM